MKRAIMLHVQNVIFLLYTFVSGVFYLCFYLVSIVLGLALSFTVVGIPLLTNVLRTTQNLVQHERIQTKIYTDISIEPLAMRPRAKGNQWMQAKTELMNVRNWISIYWLMQKFVLGCISLVIGVLIYIAPVCFAFIPLLYPFVELHFFGSVVDSGLKALQIMSLGIILMIGCSKLGNGLVLLIGGYTRLMFKAIRR
ncbi:sensor domain-containing protein [Paenibacillus farraposensis]|uniref:Sensor domain-containing protein n=1 Tax=Paenibacillus farraposensis TaxID=2807095 RepID=A0ABW4DCQ3_9BACL|nr:sensor domain-containing protein [Paenibacillus farraposensis]MCC3379417.1 sensor domain-containing protein [Paenibacillus farraposensis]